MSNLPEKERVWGIVGCLFRDPTWECSGPLPQFARLRLRAQDASPISIHQVSQALPIDNPRKTGRNASRCPPLPRVVLEVHFDDRFHASQLSNPGAKTRVS